MIRKNTVFVLGAGASVPYMFPPGRSLIGDICNLESNTSFHSYLDRAYPGLDPVANFKILSESLWGSPVPSIDQFLEHHLEFLDFGKFAIAYYFNNIHETHLKDRVNYNRDWYLSLFQEYLYERKFSDFLNNNIKFVTFNYDVSLEMFFHRAISSMFSVVQADLEEFFNKIEIVHIHGKIRSWPWESSGVTNVSELNLLPHQIKKISENDIYLIHEDSPFGRTINRAKSIIDSAEIVIFLGFGFHARNLDKLQINWDFRRRPFESTSVNLTPAMHKVINKRCVNKVGFIEMDCNNYLLNKIDSLTA